jgi:acyl carrier protein
MHDTLKRIFVRVLNLPDGEVDESISMKTVKKWDSLAHINLVLSIEQEMGTIFSPEEMQEMTSYAMIMATLAHKGILPK